jgi:predicted ATPase
LTALKQFNIYLPEQPTQADIGLVLEEASKMLSSKTICDLLNLPVMVDAKALAITKILSSIVGTAYNSAPMLFPFVVLTQVELSIRYGNTAFSAFGYCAYGVLLSSIADLDTAYQFGQLGLQLIEKFNVRSIQAKVNLVVGGFLIHCKSHLQNSLPLYVETFRTGLEVGDLEYVGYSTMCFYTSVYLIGKNLTSLVIEAETYRITLLELNLTMALNQSHTVLYAIQRLQGTQSTTELVNQLEQLYTDLVATNDLSGLCDYWTYQLTASYILNDIDQAIQDAAEARQTLSAVAGSVTSFIFYFYDSLATLAVCSTVTEQGILLDRISENQTKLQNYAHYAPMNFQHKYDLVEAERCRVLGKSYEAMEFYDRAIEGAKANGYIQEEALANELAAKFYLSWGKESIAAGYIAVFASTRYN